LSDCYSEAWIFVIQSLKILSQLFVCRNQRFNALLNSDIFLQMRLLVP
jgi:hypothetical protein